MLRLETPSGIYEVNFTHTLPEAYFTNISTKLSEVEVRFKRGSTVCTICHQESPEIVFTGKTILHEEDHYVKEVGRRISLTKALTEIQSAFGLSNKEVRDIFSAYYGR